MLSAIKIWPKTVLYLMSFQDKLNAPDFTRITAAVALYLPH